MKINLLEKSISDLSFIFGREIMFWYFDANNKGAPDRRLVNGVCIGSNVFKRYINNSNTVLIDFLPSNLILECDGNRTCFEIKNIDQAVINVDTNDFLPTCEKCFVDKFGKSNFSSNSF